MQNNYFITNSDILRNKYFLVLCFYLKKNYNTNCIYNSLFLGYKYNYLLLNINVFIKSLKNILNLIKLISNVNGEILILNTNNKIINYMLFQNCLKLNISYLTHFTAKQVNLLTYLKKLPDLVISFDYKTNAIFINKITQYNVPVICFTNILNQNIIMNKLYYVIFNNKSIYANIIILYLVFNNIAKHKFIVTDQLKKKLNASKL